MSDVGATSFLDTSRSQVVQVPASLKWDGNDGPWSTFNIFVGTPPQSVRVLVATNLWSTFLVSGNQTQGACFGTVSPSDCSQQRGGLLDVSASSTWHDGSPYNYEFDVNQPDMYNQTDLDHGRFNTTYTGYDALGLGLPETPALKFLSQRIITFSTDYWYLGFLGVMGFMNDTASSSQESTFLKSLKDSGSIASLTVAYSAGARYRQNSPASLTFGGYDSSRFVPGTGISIPMWQNSIMTSLAGLMVDLRAINLNDATNTSLLPNAIEVTVEASVPHIWLPIEACILFENAFGIVYNPTVERYVVSETLHRHLQAENASVSFILGNSSTTGEPTVNVTLPYGSFDLELGPPTVAEVQKYFPLRRAVNESQYTLGRTFLQEAYLIMDFDAQNFSIYQNVWNPNAVTNLVSINGTTASLSEQPNPANPAADIVGLVVSLVSFCSLIIGLVLEYRSKEKLRRNPKPKTHTQGIGSNEYNGKPEMEAEGKLYGELHADRIYREADSVCPIEMFADQPLELEGENEIREMKGSYAGVEKES